MVFDRATVIAPQRPRGASTIRKSTFESTFLPKWVKCCTGGGRVGEEKTFIHFVLIAFIRVENLYN